MLDDISLNRLLAATRRAARVISRDFGELEQLQAAAPEKTRAFARAGRERASATLREALSEVGPAYGWIEDNTTTPGRDPNRYWAVDPLCGMHNFAHATPGFALAAALLQHGEIEVAVILDPAAQEIYAARRGAGARRDRYRLRVAPRPHIRGALVAIDSLDPEAETIERTLGDAGRIAALGAGLRATGSPALDLAWVAAGRLDAAWLRGGRTVAALAGSLLVRESGGRATVPDADAPPSATTLAASPAIHTILAEALAA